MLKHFLLQSRENILLLTPFLLLFLNKAVLSSFLICSLSIFKAIITIYETIVHTHVLWISFRASCASSGDLEPVTKTEQPLAARSLAVDRPITLVDPVDELSYQQPTYPLRVSTKIKQK